MNDTVLAPTLGAVLEAWLATKRPTVRPETAQLYETCIRHHIIPALGRFLVTDIISEQVRIFYVAKLYEGFSPVTVGHLHRILMDALQDALRRGVVRENVAAVVDVPHSTQWHGAQARRYRHDR